MKAVHKIVAGLAVVGFAVTAAIAARPPAFQGKVSRNADGGTLGGVAASAAGLNYSTGFESTDVPAWNQLGYIAHVNGFFPDGCSGPAFPCFGHTTGGGFSTITPTIENLHPASGSQHLRVTTDGSTRTNVVDFGLGVDARYPWTDHLSVRPIDVNTVSFDVSVDGPFGSNYRLQPQSNSQTFLATSMLMFNSGGIYILDDNCGNSGLGFVSTGAFWDTSGGYQNYTVAMSPCGGNGVVTYSYAGVPLHPIDADPTLECVIAGTNLEQFLVFSDNFPAAPGFQGRIDVDNLVMQSGDGPCPSECGNGIIEPPVESCEPGNVPTGCNAGHACGAVGTPEACTCARICTLDEPCELVNGSNGPFLGPFDAQFGGIFIYNAPAGVDAVSVETCGSTGGIDNRIFYWGSCSDPADPGSANDDCYSGYSGADPTASCYGTVTAPNYESCTCHDNPIDGDNCYLLQIRGGDAMSAMITVNKKAVCGEGHLGACCDTNGPDAESCTDNVLSGDCVGADKVWTENGKCATVTCDCIPDCQGATCGDDGCGGSCGDCDDGNVCNGLETCNTSRTCDPGTPLDCQDGLVCNGAEVCDPASGCGPGSAPNCNDNNACTTDGCAEPNGCFHNPVNCDNGLACDGVEACTPSTGCVPGTPVNCDDGIDCTADSCSDPSGTCVNDDADCSIPTVSEWGLVVLTLMLLIGAKVYFGRRQAIA